MQDRVVIITGGGTGIGRAAALQFAQAGASIAVVGRRATPLEEVASVSDRIVPIVADIQRAPDIRDVVHGATKRWGRIEVVVNSAGAFAQRPLENIEQQLMTDLFATNIVGPALLSQTALPYLKSTQGAIVKVSSAFRHKAAPMIAHNAASKAALEHLTRCWALELAPDRIQVNAVAPGRRKRAF